MKFLWALTLSGAITGVTVGNPLDEISGCYELSNTILVTEQPCEVLPPQPDDIYIIVPASSTEVACVTLENGFDPATTTFVLNDGNISGKIGRASCRERV